MKYNKTNQNDKATAILRQKNSEIQSLIKKLDWRHPATANNLDLTTIIDGLEAEHAALVAVAEAAQWAIVNAELITKLCDDAAFLLCDARAVHKDATQHNQFAEIIALEIVEDARKLKQKIDRFAVAASQME